MAKPLRLFIKPPYDAWGLDYGFGELGPRRVPLPGNHWHVLLHTAGPGQLYAAAEGILSARAPADGFPEPDLPLTIPVPGTALPPNVNLFLHISPVVAANAAFRVRSEGIYNVLGFAYLNVDTASLAGALAELLDASVIPHPPRRDQIVDMLVRGQLNVRVTSGHAIGTASPLGAAPGNKQSGFTVLTHYGSIDPAYTYDWMRAFIEDAQADVDALFVLMPVRWPLFEDALTTDDIIVRTADVAYSMAVLQDLRSRRVLTAPQWRQIGDNQKRLLQRRLLKLTGRVDPANVDPRFEFDDLDWQNIFQLEAVVEFYVNFNDPWSPGAVRVAPNDAGYQGVDLLDGGWHVIIIDSFGPRHSGENATAAGNALQLRQPLILAFMNEQFDTIYLPSDTARTSQTFRVTGVDFANATVIVDGNPILDGGKSAWQLPAGLSGQLPGPEPDFDQVNPGSLGTDHYDGMAFIVKGGEVRGKFRWTSYTSRANENNPDLSSLRGNKRYTFSSFRSSGDGAEFRNYCFKVTEPPEEDKVTETRFYFQAAVAQGLPKPRIRLHHGNGAGNSTGSRGCLVSTQFEAFRDRMIELYQDDHRTAHGGNPDREMAKLYGRNHKASKKLWADTQDPKVEAKKKKTKLRDADWNRKLSGTLWLIRPDERPL